MKYTNNKGISPFIASMIQASMEKYSSEGSKYSATTLIDSPRLVALKRKHEHELEQDVGDLLEAFNGNALHYYLEHLAPEGSIPERRYFTEVDGIKISCCADILIHLGRGIWQLGDYKNVKAWAVVFGEIFDKWEQQLNINAYIISKNGVKLHEEAFVEYFLKGHMKNKASDETYPDIAQGRKTFTLWPEEQQLAFIRERVALHDAAMDNLPLCSDKERWIGNKWKLMKRGRKTSVKNENTEACLIKYAKKKGLIKPNGLLREGYSIQEVGGEPKRCVPEYCVVCKFCDQAKGLLD